MSKTKSNPLSVEFLYELYATAMLHESVCGVLVQYMEKEYLPDRSFQRIQEVLANHFRNYNTPPSYAILSQAFHEDYDAIELINTFQEYEADANPEVVLDMLETYIKGVRLQSVYNEVGKLYNQSKQDKAEAVISGKTKIDIIITPLITILSGSTAGLLIGPSISKFMTWLGTIIMFATEQQPFIMGLLVSVIMGILLTLPISSAAIGVILNLNGITAGAATIGCCCQMVGFAVASYRENKLGGLLAQGIGTSMLQIPNIVKKPVIWLPAIISSAILGPVSSVIFKMTNNATGSGMGSAGFVGQIMTYQTMIGSTSSKTVILQIILMHFILPALLTLLISEFMRRKEWIKQGDMALDI